MSKIDKVIAQTKHLINLPYNYFNLENYFTVLRKYYDIYDVFVNENKPIKLMSGNHRNAQIIKSGKGHIYIIGKGILFDSGGLDLKHKMYGMTSDKAGMLIGLAVAQLYPNKVIAFCPVTTNFIQTSKITPGDVYQIGNKKVEVNNTDAEGRLILAEAISQLNVSENDIIITLATLTGCCEYAVDKAVGVFAVNNTLAQKYIRASETAKEYAWQLPMFAYMQKFYKKQPFKNAEDKIKAGASEGAMFIRQFIKYPQNWLHLDIAPVVVKNNRATGIPIKSLINFIKEL
jgi:leucyl aminopeptidase